MIAALFFGRDIFERYVFKHTAVAMIVTAIVLAAIILLTQSLRFLELIIEAGASGTTFWLLTVMALPRFFEVILPIAMAIGTIFVYNRLASDSEIVVARAAGLSPLLLAKPALTLSLYISLIMLFITTWLAPTTLSNMQEMRQVIKAQYSTLLLREGIFNQFGDELTVYVHRKTEAGELQGLIIHDSRQDLPAPVTVIAERGIIVVSDDGQQVLVYDGSRQDVNAETGTLNKLNFERYSIDLPEGRDVRLRWKEPDERTFFELLNPNEELERDRRNRDVFIAEAHRRLAVPFLAISFTAVTLSFLLLGPLNRRGQSQRVFYASLSVIALQGLFLAIANKTVGSAIGVLLLYMIVFLPLFFSLFMLSPWSEKLRAVYLFRLREERESL
ncbi:MAG: LptF/LptG family permease [Pseudomonadota bacterium]